MPKGLTTIFIGGWMEDGVARDDGDPTIRPIPMRIVEYLMRHGVIAMNACSTTRDLAEPDPDHRPPRTRRS
jgi:hypothetical protein